MTAASWKDGPRQAALDLDADLVAIDAFLDGEWAADPWPDITNPLERKRRWGALRAAIWWAADMDNDWDPAWDAHEATDRHVRSQR
ncbi:MAG: hypothetical protein GY913_19210 [Proteobacteria bacterium]|nr:hypothetical protein [Pseudomonadota bacterium]